VIARRTFCAGAGCGLIALGVGCSGDAPAADDGGTDDGGADLTTAPGCNTAAPLDAGPASAIPLNGATHFTDGSTYDLFVCRDAGGLFTVDATCTHAGCEVRFSAGRFRCPCHGASFDFQGQNPQAPAPTPLANYAVCVDGSGKVLVDYNTTVSPTTRAPG